MGEVATSKLRLIKFRHVKHRAGKDHAPNPSTPTSSGRRENFRMEFGSGRPVGQNSPDSAPTPIFAARDSSIGLDILPSQVFARYMKTSSSNGHTEGPKTSKPLRELRLTVDLFHLFVIRKDDERPKCDEVTILGKLKSWSPAITDPRGLLLPGRGACDYFSFELANGGRKKHPTISFVTADFRKIDPGARRIAQFARPRYVGSLAHAPQTTFVIGIAISRANSIKHSVIPGRRPSFGLWNIRMRGNETDAHGRSN